jgi:selenocysteine-specific elongation factor
MKHVIIGTAGHVDHGKTTLIQALTGTNPDRLKEEQERGMTIDIGFAALKLPDGTIAGIVDVPGHERFLKNMLAGATGVDVVLLVVAADEGVMPQTREHLDILRILDVRNGVVALTKMDTVDKEWADAVTDEIREHLAGTFLASSPIIRVSAATGKGIEALKRELMAAVSRAEARNAALPFRLPVDRVFTRPGFGTVVTGTLVAGTLHVGDAVALMPQNVSSRVRGLQVHGQKVQTAEAGSRVAVNLAGIETEDIERGAQIAPPNSLPATSTIDAVLHLLPDAPALLEDRARVRVHLGTAELIGRIRLLGAEKELAPGDRAYIQFQGETSFAAARGDRFVLRRYSPMQTMGGGTILDPTPARHKKNDAETLAALASRERGTPDDILETVLLRHGTGIGRAELTAQSGMPSQEAETALNTLIESYRATLLPGDRFIATTFLNSLRERAAHLIERYHEQFPLRAGMPREEVRAALGRAMDTKTFTALSNHWNNRGAILSEGAIMRLPDFRISLNERQTALLGRIESFFIACGVATPTIEETAQEIKAPPDAITALLRFGVEQGKFFKVADAVFYHTRTVDEMKQIARELFDRDGDVSVGAFRDRLQTNRKWSVQALEFLDAIRFTRRENDKRVLM